MKKLNVKRLLNLRSFALVGIFAVAILATSCSDEMPAPAVQDAELRAGRPDGVPRDAETRAENSIAAIALDAAPEFTELVSALAYVDGNLDAGLIDLFLNGTDQYTVFAPTNEAFQALYDALGDEVESITDLPAELVLDVLLYHVTEGRRGSNSVVPPMKDREIETLLGVTFSVTPQGSIIAIGNSANIVEADISASNGIIHVIDAVILP